MQDYISRPLWVQGSPTALYVNNLCESLIQQNVQQHCHYACRCVSELEIEIVRLPGTAPAFCLECNSSTICPTCCDRSPIARFKRKRKIIFTAIENGEWFIMECTCPFQPDTGIPCRHMARLLQAQPHHIHIRYHKAYVALYKRPGYENETARFKEQQRDRRLRITREEYDQIMSYVGSNSQEQDSVFDIPTSSCFQKRSGGLIPHQFTEDLTDNNQAADSTVSNSQDMFGHGFLSQEVGIPSEGEEEDGEEKDGALEGETTLTWEQPYLSGNAFNDMVATLQTLTAGCRAQPGVTSAMASEFYSFAARWQSKIFGEAASQTDYNGDIVSCYSAVDSRRVAKRIRSATEPNRRRKTTKTAKPQLTMEESVL